MLITPKVRVSYVAYILKERMLRGLQDTHLCDSEMAADQPSPPPCGKTGRMAIGRCRTVIARCGLSVRHGMSLVIALSRQAPLDRSRSFGLGMCTNLSLDAVRILSGMKADEVNNIRPSSDNDERSVLVEVLPELQCARLACLTALCRYGRVLTYDPTKHPTAEGLLSYPWICLDDLLEQAIDRASIIRSHCPHCVGRQPHVETSAISRVSEKSPNMKQCSG